MAASLDLPALKKTLTQEGNVMKRTHLLAALVSLAAISILASDAQAMYNPAVGRWMQRDPAGYADTGSLYLYVRASPVTSLGP